MPEQEEPGIIREKSSQDAMRDLRARLGMTQQQFANKMDMAIRSVARYESDRTPKTQALVRFSVIAEENGWHDLATVFNNLLISQLGMSARNSVIAAGRLREALDDLTKLYIDHPELEGDLREIIGKVQFALNRLMELNPFKEGPEPE